MIKTSRTKDATDHGRRLDLRQLRLGAVLGAGTVGVVRAGRLPDGRPVAVKILHSQWSDDPLIRARFRREMDILRRLDHPHIIRYFGGGESNGQLFYAMERMPHGNLRELLQRYPRLRWEETASIGRQIASALQCIHNQGIVHRDVKPSNIFLQADGTVKLGDFGIARDTLAGDLAAPGVTVGTHAYMAPEQIRGQSSVGPKADLYALGCVLFETLSGHPPFRADDAQEVLRQHLHTPPPRVECQGRQCPEELERLIHQMLDKSPERRPFNARSVQNTLSRMLVSLGAPAVSAAEPPENAADNEISPPVDPARDIDALDPGKRLLAQRILDRQQPQVTWQQFLLIGGLIATLILLARWLS
ncbi:MAG: serine/threonine protein kinase [Pirellulaceae bacterium]|nr:MAG: serine/threonine protein kinase [Pirellulaceae bacterium]